MAKHPGQKRCHQQFQPAGKSNGEREPANRTGSQRRPKGQQNDRGSSLTQVRQRLTCDISDCLQRHILQQSGGPGDKARHQAQYDRDKDRAAKEADQRFCGSLVSRRTGTGMGSACAPEDPADQNDAKVHRQCHRELIQQHRGGKDVGDNGPCQGDGIAEETSVAEGGGHYQRPVDGAGQMKQTP